MVRRLLRLLTREFSSLHEAAVLLAAAAIGSQLLSLVRDRLLASQFGASQSLDVYYAAFRLPDLIYAAVASLVSITVLIPFIVERLERDGPSATRRFLGQILSCFLMVVLAVAAIAFLALPWLGPWLAPGLTAQAQTEFVALSRLLLLSPILLGLSNLFGSVVQSFRLFFLYALSPIFYNLGIIVGAWWLVPNWGIFGLGLGVVLGAAAHWLIQAPAVWSSRIWPWPLWPRDWSALWPVFKLSLPRTLALSAQNLSLLVLVAVATLLGEGSVTVFNFAFNLQSVPLAVVGVSYSVAAFPTLVRLARGPRDSFLAQVGNAARHILFWSLPAVVLFVVLRAQIVRVILGSGLFDWRDTRLTAAALALFAVSVPVQSLSLLFIRAYYSAGLTRRPVLISLAAAASQIIFAAAGLWWWFNSPEVSSTVAIWLRVGDLTETAIVVLPLAFSLGALGQFIWLRSAFARDFGPLPTALARTTRELIAASLLAGAAAYFGLNWFDDWFDLNRFWGIFGQGLLAGLLGLGAFVGSLVSWRNRELRELVASLHRRFWRAEVAAESPDLVR